MKTLKKTFILLAMMVTAITFTACVGRSNTSVEGNISDNTESATSEKGNEQVLFKSYSDVTNYLEGKTYVCGEYSIQFSSHGYCVTDGSEYNATLSVVKFHETTANVLIKYRTIASDFTQDYEIDVVAGTALGYRSGKNLTFKLQK